MSFKKGFEKGFPARVPSIKQTSEEVNDLKGTQ